MRALCMCARTRVLAMGATAGVDGGGMPIRRRVWHALLHALHALLHALGTLLHALHVLSHTLHAPLHVQHAPLHAHPHA